MTQLTNTYTSTGSKFFAHQETMMKLRNGQGQPITCHVMLTDVCNHKCAFCSVQARAGDSLPFNTVTGFLAILQKYGLKSVILSGGGNPILYKCKETGKDINDVIDWISEQGLEIGLITNGMPLKEFSDWESVPNTFARKSWKTLKPNRLDVLTWIRISMSGLDHEEQEVYVPEINPNETTLGFSYVAHDIYDEPADPHHGKVSRPLDLISGDKGREPTWAFEERIPQLIRSIRDIVSEHHPKYVRLLPNCLEPNLIELRCKQLEYIANTINSAVGYECAFVQYKPPKAPTHCYLGYVHPVLNCDGFVYPCDSCVLNEAAGHAFSNPWRICRWDEIGSIYEAPVRSLIDDPSVRCPGCVFPQSNEILRSVVEGRANLTSLEVIPEHHNFV